MAAAKKHSRSKGRKSHKNSFFCFFGGCFGISNKVSADHGDGKSVKNASTNSGRQGRTAPANDHKIPTSSEIVSSSKGIHVVEGDEKKRSRILAPHADELMSNKIRDTTSEKSKNEDELSPMTNAMKRVDKQHSIAQKTWTNPTKLSRSGSLPLPDPEKERTGAVGGDEKGKKVRELSRDGEFDPMFGAFIIMVTLVVMLIWGKACAILCTAAWFYFIPRFRANMDEYYAVKLKNGDKENVDLDSWEYKKKVVLQGLLDRNQHL